MPAWTEERKVFWLELAIAALLGMTAVATAWAGYKATVVRDDASSAATQGIRSLNLGTSYSIHSDEVIARDRAIFVDYRRAVRAGDEAGGASILRDEARPELKAEIRWWRRQASGRYATPFVKDDPYNVDKYLSAGRQLRAISDQLFSAADGIAVDANRYELLTVILAASLFMLGLAGVLRDLRFRLTLLVMGTVILLACTAELGRLAARDVHFSCEKYLSVLKGACS
jgi:hypothetical protein